MPDPERGREQQRLATRRRIVRAAVDSFEALGYAATTTLEVQRRAGVSRGALLHHFRTRAELVAAAVAELVSQNGAASRESLAQASGDLDPIDRARSRSARSCRVPRSVSRWSSGWRRDPTASSAPTFGRPSGQR